MKKVLLVLLSLALIASTLLFVGACKKNKDSSTDSTGNEQTVTYTVTYSGTDLSPEVYEAGATITQPSDPTKSGEVFVGWYADADYSTRYSFGTAITGNVTVYARFVAPIDPEFTVSYVVDGKVTSSVSTVGGMAIDAPVPTKAGHTFVGWWISDYDDEAKLSHKYEGEVLAQNTELYAVWDKAAVSVKDNVITWPVKSGTSLYDVSIKKDGVEVSAHRQTGGSNWSYDFSAADAGDYEISVTVDDETNTAYYKNKALAKVSVFEVRGRTLLFNEVENAQHYYITIDCGNDDHQHVLYPVLYDNEHNPTYDFSGCEMKVGGIDFTVTASAEGYADSVSKVFNYEANLGAVQDLSVDAATAEVSWNEVKNAEYYEVEIGDEVFTASSANYSLKHYGEGTYNIKVTAKAHGYNSSFAEVSYNKTSIAAPAYVALNGSTVSWDAVAGATSYKVKVGDTEYDVAEGTEYTLDGVDGSVEVSVKAVKSGADSAYSDAVTVSAVLGDLSYNDGVVSWANVYGASAYNVKINGQTVASKITDNHYNVVFTKDGNNEISVTSLDGQVETGTKSLTVYAYEVSFDAEGGSALDVQYYAEGDRIAVAGNTTKYGYTFDSWYDAKGAASANGKKLDLSVFTVSKNVMLFAQWTPNKVAIDLDVFDENASLADSDVELTFGDYYTLPVPSNTDELKIFTGWYSDANAGGTRYTDEQGNSYGKWIIDRESMTLYAGWLGTLAYESINNNTEYSVVAGVNIDHVTTVKIPAVYNGKPVTTIEGSAFRNCKNLVSIYIPDTIQLVETGTAFLSCDSLTTLELYEVPADVLTVETKPYYTVDGVLFYDNPNNEGREIKYYPLGKTGSYSIPVGVQVIPLNVFRSAKIDVLHVPYTVVKIDKNAFSGHAFSSIIFDNAPAGVEEEPLDITDGAFGYGMNLTSVTFPKRLRTFTAKVFGTNYGKLSEVKMEGTGEYFSAENGVLMNANKTEIIYCPPAKTSIEIPATVQTIGKNAFEGCAIVSVSIPANVTKIDENAFKSCPYLKDVTFEGTLSDDALTIEANAFLECNKIATVTLPGNLKTLKANAFANCTVLQKVVVNSGSEVEFEAGAFFDKRTGGSNLVELDIGPDFYCANVGGVFGGKDLATLKVDAANPNFKAIDNILYVIHKDDNTLGVQYYPQGVRISNLVLGDNVSTIADRVFENNINLKSVTIPASVRTIGAYAFSGARFIETITFTERQASDGLEIGNYAFYNCQALTSLTLPAGTSKMGDYDTSGNIADLKVFNGCSSLTAINVEAGCAKFYSVDGILYGTNNDGRKVLYVAPANCAVTALEIPTDMNEIFDYAFSGNTSIETITFASATVSE
ncbi:MAG: leucine-rich repeat protein, partial [Clostridia bacterium]|nr:leucine-rich repeat protein [Clostridia bacterium]